MCIMIKIAQQGNNFLKIYTTRYKVLLSVLLNLSKTQIWKSWHLSANFILFLI